VFDHEKVLSGVFEVEPVETSRAQNTEYRLFVKTYGLVGLVMEIFWSSVMLIQVGKREDPDKKSVVTALPFLVSC
jgi:hypothetical protein